MVAKKILMAVILCMLVIAILLTPLLIKTTNPPSFGRVPLLTLYYNYEENVTKIYIWSTLGHVKYTNATIIINEIIVFRENDTYVPYSSTTEPFFTLNIIVNDVVNDDENSYVFRSDVTIVWRADKADTEITIIRYDFSGMSYPEEVVTEKEDFTYEKELSLKE